MTSINQDKTNYTPLPEPVLPRQNVSFQTFRIETFLFSLFMFFLIFTIVKFGSTDAKFAIKNNDQNFKFTNNIRAAMEPMSALSVLPNKKSFFLKELGGERYQLAWSEGGLSSDLSKTRIHKVNETQEIFVTDTNIKIDWTSSEDQFKVVSALGDSDYVFITQVVENGLLPRQILLNIKSGLSSDPTEQIKNIDDSCTGYPFEKLPGNIGEKYLFICLDKSSGNEVLNYYDLITQKSDILITLTEKDTFNCSPGIYQYGLSFVPIEPDSMEIAVCLSPNHNAEKNVLVPTRYELIDF